MYAEMIRLGLVSLLRSNLYNFSLFATHINTVVVTNSRNPNVVSIHRKMAFSNTIPRTKLVTKLNVRLLETPRETREWKEKSTVVFDVGRKTETTFWFEVIGSFENMKVLEIILIPVYATRLAVSSIGAIIWRTICHQTANMIYCMFYLRRRAL